MSLTRVYPTSGADGDGVTTTNSPSVATIVRSGSGSGTGTITVESSDAHGIPGVSSRAFRFTKDATSAPNYLAFNQGVTADTEPVRIWIWFTALPSASASILRFMGAAGAAAFFLGVNNSGKVFLQNAAGSNITAASLSGATAMTTGVLYRIEFYVDNDDTAGSIKVRVIKDSDSSVLGNQTVITGLDMAATNLASFRLGGSVNSSTVTVDFDAVLDYDPGATDYLAAYSATSPPSPAGAVTLDKQFIDCSTSAATGSDTGVAVQSISPSTGTVIAPDENGHIGVYVPNTTQTYTVTIKGTPSNLTATFNVTVTALVGSTVNVSAPRRPTGSVPGTTWA